MSFRRVTRSSQPPDIIHPDRSNRLLAGCTHLFSYTRINLITNEIPAYPASVASGLLVPTSQGLGFNYNSTGSPYWAATTAANQINASNPWTTACLVQFFDTAATPISMVVNAIDSTTRDRGLSIIAGSQVEGYLFDGGAQTIVSPGAIVAGRVYNIVLSAGGGNFTLYIDGVQVATKAVANNGYNGYVAQPIFSLGHGSNASATSTGTATLLMLLKTDNVYWGPAQAAEFYRNPWQVFAASKRIVISAPAITATSWSQFPKLLPGQKPGKNPPLRIFKQGIPTGINISVDITAGQITLAGQASALTIGIATANGQVTLSGQSVTAAIGISAGNGQITVAGQSTTATFGIAANSGQITIAGQSSSTSLGIAAANGQITFAGQSAIFSLSITALPGNIFLAGQDSTIVLAGNISIDMGGGQITLSGQDVTTALTVIQTQNSGGWPYFYDYAWERSARKRKLEEARRAEEEIEREIDRNIARLLHQKQAKDEEREDLERIRSLVRQYKEVAPVDISSERVLQAIDEVKRKENRASLEKLQREFERMVDEEEQALIIFLNDYLN